MLGWRENERGKKMREENGVRGSIFPCLNEEKIGEERKERGKVGGPHAPFYFQVFSPKMERL